jgi:hypothetical protein
MIQNLQNHLTTRLIKEKQRQTNSNSNNNNNNKIIYDAL